MAKEKVRGGDLSALGKPITAQASSAMDYYFDHLKKTVASFTFGRNRIRREGESLRGAKHFRHLRIREGAYLRQGYSRYTANSDGVRAVATGRFWRTG